MNKPKEDILKFMKTDEYTDFPFTKFVKRFNLSKKEFIHLVETHMKQSPLKIFEWTDKQIAIG